MTFDDPAWRQPPGEAWSETSWDETNEHQPVGTARTAVPIELDDPEEQWFFQFHEHLLLTVQAVHRLREALAAKMP